jgi:transposase
MRSEISPLSKRNRSDCRQVVVGQIVNEAGIPILQKVQNGSTPDVTWNARTIEYLRQVQEKGFRYGVFVEDSKLVTHDLVISMNDPERRIPFVSRCPSNFEGKLEERCILKAYRESKWEDMGQFHSGEKAASYRACCFKEAGAVPQIEERYHLKAEETTVKDQEGEEYLKKASCIVLISNVPEEEDGDIDLMWTYKDQQVVENSFRELKSPDMASVIYLKNPEMIKALSMLLSPSLLIRAVIQYQMREGLKETQKEKPGVKLRAGWGGRVLEKPTYRLLYEHSVNCYFEKEKSGVYSYAWPSMETRERVEPLLKLLEITLDELIG